MRPERSSRYRCWAGSGRRTARRTRSEIPSRARRLVPPASCVRSARRATAVGLVLAEEQRGGRGVKYRPVQDVSSLPHHASGALVALPLVGWFWPKNSEEDEE